MVRSHSLAFAMLVAGSVGSTAAAPVSSPLLPLTQRDKDRVDAVGCIFQFESHRKVMLYAIENVMTVRTKTGAALCRPTEPTFSAFRDAHGGVTCGGQRLRLKPIGKQVDDAAGDGSSRPAALTIGTGRAAMVLRGEIATAC